MIGWILRPVLGFVAAIVLGPACESERPRYSTENTTPMPPY